MGPPGPGQPGGGAGLGPGRGERDRPADPPRPVAFGPGGQGELAPAGERAKLAANLAALEVLERLRGQGRWAAPAEQAVLARWAGWGALSRLFDEDDDSWAAERARARAVLGETGWRAARRTTLNAHYTDAGLAGAMWRGVAALGFQSGRVLEPGCGSGTFLALAPPGAELVGVELDPTTAAIAAHLYGARAEIHAGALEEWTAAGTFDLVIGNVPFVF